MELWDLQGLLLSKYIYLGWVLLWKNPRFYGNEKESYGYVQFEDSQHFWSDSEESKL
jgi:hypothetical protein